MAKRPRSRISYENIFADIAKNRKDSCEVIRELISNSGVAGLMYVKGWHLR